MRQIVLDTETTGLSVKEGHRIVEIGCVEIENRRLTGNHFHQYLNPQREVDKAAVDVHGLTDEFLADKPGFAHIEPAFIEFVSGAELLIHNAPFDIGFLDHELKLAESRVSDMASICTVLDTLVLAQQKHPGQNNTLDRLCKRYGVDNSCRELHGALLDAELLADVYLKMSSGQSSLSLQQEPVALASRAAGQRTADRERPALRVIRASEDELACHRQRIRQLDEKCPQRSLWSRLQAEAGEQA